MKRKLYRVKATLVERIVIESHVFAESRPEAERLVQNGQGERLSRYRKIVEKPTFRAKLDKGEES